MKHKSKKRVEMEFEPRAISYYCSSILHLWAQKTEDGSKQKWAFQKMYVFKYAIGIGSKHVVYVLTAP